MFHMVIPISQTFTSRQNVDRNGCYVSEFAIIFGVYAIMSTAVYSVFINKPLEMLLVIFKKLRSLSRSDQPFKRPVPWSWLGKKPRLHRREEVDAKLRGGQGWGVQDEFRMVGYSWMVVFQGVSVHDLHKSWEVSSPIGRTTSDFFWW